jgi:hypothetical protein
MAKPKNGLHIDELGDKCWYLNGKRHREDGPAEEWADGTKCWYWWLNGVYLGEGVQGFGRNWEKLTHAQRCNLNLHKWLAMYT